MCSNDRASSLGRPNRSAKIVFTWVNKSTCTAQKNQKISHSALWLLGRECICKCMFVASHLSQSSQQTVPQARSCNSEASVDESDDTRPWNSECASWKVDWWPFPTCRTETRHTNWKKYEKSKTDMLTIERGSRQTFAVCDMLFDI